MLRVETKTRVLMDNGKIYEFPEPAEQFLKKICDIKTLRVDSILLKGEGFYINTAHISAIEETEAMIKEEKLEDWEMERMAVELRRTLREGVE